MVDWIVNISNVFRSKVWLNNFIISNYEILMDYPVDKIDLIHWYKLYHHLGQKINLWSLSPFLVSIFSPDYASAQPPFIYYCVSLTHDHSMVVTHFTKNRFSQLERDDFTCTRVRGLSLSLFFSLANMSPSRSIVAFFHCLFFLVFTFFLALREPGFTFTHLYTYEWVIRCLYVRETRGKVTLIKNKVIGK